MAGQKDTDARWTVKVSKAKPAADGAPQIDIAIPTFGYKSHIGIARATAAITLANMAYNMKRWRWLDSRSLSA